MSYFTALTIRIISYRSTRLVHRGYAVTQLVEALRYKPEGRGFDFRWGL